MTIGIASGKGGTGKTTIAVSLALGLLDQEPVCLTDTDVEEPNAHLFIGGSKPVETPAFIAIPVIDNWECTGCGTCADKCQFNAIAIMNGKATLFPELCHSCGRCAWVCPASAISERPGSLGTISRVEQGRLSLFWGTLAIPYPSAPPLIKHVLDASPKDTLRLVDCPPGTSCAMIAAARACDFLLLVTEPTPFGLNDLKLAVATLRLLDRPFGVIINRSDWGDDRVESWCREESIPILMKLGFLRSAAAGIARGKALIEIHPELIPSFRALVTAIRNQGIKSEAS